MFDCLLLFVVVVVVVMVFFFLGFPCAMDNWLNDLLIVDVDLDLDRVTGPVVLLIGDTPVIPSFVRDVDCVVNSGDRRAVASGTSLFRFVFLFTVISGVECFDSGKGIWNKRSSIIRVLYNSMQ